MPRFPQNNVPFFLSLFVVKVGEVKQFALLVAIILDCDLRFIKILSYLCFWQMLKAIMGVHYLEKNDTT